MMMNFNCLIGVSPGILSFVTIPELPALNWLTKSCGLKQLIWLEQSSKYVYPSNEELISNLIGNSISVFVDWFFGRTEMESFVSC